MDCCDGHPLDCWSAEHALAPGHCLAYTCYRPTKRRSSVQRGSKTEQGQRTHKNWTWEQMWILRLEEPDEQTKKLQPRRLSERRADRESATVVDVLGCHLGKISSPLSSNREHGARAAGKDEREEKSWKEGKSLGLGRRRVDTKLAERGLTLDRIHLPGLALRQEIIPRSCRTIPLRPMMQRCLRYCA